MKRFHVIIDINQMPTQFDVAEVVENKELKFKVSTANHEAIIMQFDEAAGELKIEGHADVFWQQMERELGYKIQFDNL